ncbi:cytochrome C oxidase subunit II, transmembrane domain-containing protein [Mrakia frigida]|uniref:cytochrome C oxidase subunit II, transmembrane domain-containing protein n=1 Tax=Mrakia frigida TaxID=29902 RepID=UPI003FCC183E
MINLDAPEPWQYGFQDGASVTMEGITELHNAVMYFVVAIMVGVVYAMGAILYRFRISKNPISSKYLNHGTLIELIWTITPAFVLIAVAFPSFRLLYLMDEVISPALTLKVMGHQWYWSYEYCDFINSEEDDE